MVRQNGIDKMLGSNVQKDPPVPNSGRSVSRSANTLEECMLPGRPVVRDEATPEPCRNMLLRHCTPVRRIISSRVLIKKAMPAMRQV